MITRGLRGVGMAQPPQVMVPVPQPGGVVTQMPTAETQLANAVYQDVSDYTQFLAASNTPQYQNPNTYAANLLAYAKSLCYGSWAPYTCVGFDPDAMTAKYLNVLATALQGIILPSTGLSVYQTWLAHPPAVTSSYVPPADTTPYNPANVPGSNTLTNVAPQPTNVTPAPQTNVMTPPPFTESPVTIQQIQNGNGAQSGSGVGFDMSGATSWLEAHWELVAVGVAAVILLPMLGGKR